MNRPDEDLRLGIPTVVSPRPERRLAQVTSGPASSCTSRQVPMRVSPRKEESSTIKGHHCSFPCILERCQEALKLHSCMLRRPLLLHSERVSTTSSADRLHIVAQIRVKMSFPVVTEGPLDTYARNLSSEFPSPIGRDVSKKSYVEPSANEAWSSQTEIFEYTSAANPRMAPVPVLGLLSSEHRSGPTRVVTLDLSKELKIDGYPATSPNLLASFLRICEGEKLTTRSCATSQVFFVIHGKGSTCSPVGEVKWSSGDLFVIPAAGEDGTCVHTCEEDAEEMTGGAGVYWITDSPLLAYLGVVPKVKRFEPSFFSRDVLLSNVEAVRHDPLSAHRNRLGILLGNKATSQTKTLTHTLWSLLNVLPAGNVQKPHRHNSVALDLAVYAAPGTYTLMGKELDVKGNILNPIKAVWETGAMFVTPPGWWHSHHNESSDEAWVLPVQDAGLYTHQRTLDIRFAEEEIRLHAEGHIK